MWDPFADFEHVRLDNGLDTYITEWPGRSWCHVGIVIHAGAMHDEPGKEGTGHFLEHLVSGNVEGMTTQGIGDMFEGWGGSVRLGTTFYDKTQYGFSVPNSREPVGKALDLMGHMLIAPFPRRRMEEERAIITTEYHRCFPLSLQAEIAWRAKKAVHAGLWGERFVRPLGHPESIAGITRQDCWKFGAGRYVPANMSIVCVSGSPVRTMEVMIRASRFGLPKRGTRTALMDPLPVVPLPRELMCEMSGGGTDLGITADGYTTKALVPGTCSSEAMVLFREVLARHVFEEVRTKRSWGYAPTVGCGRHGGVHEVDVSCSSLTPGVLGKVEEVVAECIARTGEDWGGVCRERDSLLARQQMLDMTGNGVCAGAMADLGALQHIETLEENEREMRRVTPEDIRAIAAYLSPERRWKLLLRA